MLSSRLLSRTVTFLIAIEAVSSLCNAEVPVVLSTLTALTNKHVARNATSDGFQSLVTWDDHSLIINGERTLIYSGEFHPFRLPSPGLWLDVFQKIKALGYTAVSFYLNWALLEGEPEKFKADGIFDFKPFLEAAKEAGLYLIARPGPYINSEVSGGGLPGWLQRTPAALRSTDPGYLEPALRYLSIVAPILAEYQITRGGPIALLQVENEYSLSNVSLAILAEEGLTPEVIAMINKDLVPQYMQDIEDEYRSLGIEIPLTFNDAIVLGHWAPGSGVGAVDLYGNDAYPFGYGTSCTDTSSWPSSYLLTEQAEVNYTLHLQLSPSTPHAIFEFQGGNPQGWGGSSQAKDCGALFNAEWESVIYKQLFSQSVTLFNIYMTYGGTNWGNLGYPGGITSYDQGSVISEDRLISREKYSEAKLLASSLKVSPAYLSTTPRAAVAGGPASTPNITVTVLDSHDELTKFYVVRHTDYASTNATSYHLTLDTSVGNVTVPQIGDASLTLIGRDSKIHVVDYSVSNETLVYSTAEVFTWSNISGNPVVLLYGSMGETHELAVEGEVASREGFCMVKKKNNLTIIQWQVKSTRQVITFVNGLQLYLLWRNDAYNYWSLEVPTAAVSTHKEQLIVKAGYLVRNSSVIDNRLFLTGDVNATTEVEVIAAPSSVNEVFWNAEPLASRADNGLLSGIVTYNAPKLTLPDLSSLPWKYLDSLPEIKHGYNDSAWASCDITYTNNTYRNITTPTSLYSGDYGFHPGSFLYRGHFTAGGNGTTFLITTQGGLAYGHSIWLDSEFLGSWQGNSTATSYSQSFDIGGLLEESEHVFTVLIDSMGYEENFLVGSDDMKTPRGILDYSFPGQQIEWKVTGNLGGEQYQDKARGPLNEGSMFAERQGYHLPIAPTAQWSSKSPLEGLNGAGIGFYYASFDLDIPIGYDVPLSVVFSNSTTSTGLSTTYRVQLFINGYQFGKYVNNIGPQDSFPVPEGILNHRGVNYIALTLWAQGSTGASLAGIALKPSAAIQSGYGQVASAPQPPWEVREGAY